VTVYVACSTLCFAKLPFDEALRVMREMRFVKIDLAIHEEGPHLKPSEVAADVGKIAVRMKATNLAVAAIHAQFAEHDSAEVRVHLKALCRLARILAVPLLTVAAAPASADLAVESERLIEWTAIAAAEGVILTVETKVGTLTADPLGAVELCRLVPGLGITLDPSHYHCGPHAGANYDSLFPHVRHVRLRDTGKSPELFSVRVGQGEIEYGRIVTQLERMRYDRCLSVDIQDVPDNAFPVEPEVRKLKYLLESLV